MKLKDLELISEGEVIKGNFGKKKEEDKPVGKGEELTLLQAFGSAQQNILADAGIHFVEKPAYWSELEKHDPGVSRKYHPITQIMMKKVEKELAKQGFKLAELTAASIYGGDPSGPMQRYAKKPEPEMYIVKLKDGQRYLCDQSANTYCRMWAKIV